MDGIPWAILEFPHAATFLASLLWSRLEYIMIAFQHMDGGKVSPFDV
jgi:hypothetical protein